MRKYSKRLEILRELFNAPPEEHLKQQTYYSPSYRNIRLLQIIKPWVNNKVRDLLPKQKAGEKNPELKSQDWVIADVLVHILEYATPNLQFWNTGSIPGTSKLRDNLVESLEYITTFHNEDWDKLFVPIFEDFIKVVKSFKDFNMVYLMDFLANNEQHDLWLIVLMNKDYEDESADRFSL